MAKFIAIMQLLIQQATVIAPTTTHHLLKRDIFIENGIIKSIAPQLNIDNTEVINAANAHVSIGWMDIGVQTGEPGFEHREDLNSVTLAASAGGFTAIASFPNANPPIHSRSEVQYLKHFSDKNIVEIYPIGAISKACAGKDIAEFYDMHDAGAIGFSDGLHSLKHTGLLIRALQYAQGISSVILHHPNDQSVGKDGQMNEGKISTSLGLQGIPSMSEELMLQRDLEALAYSGGRLHLHNISTARSVELVRAAKLKGLNVTASVAVMNIALTDEALLDFDTNCKVQPPLRTQSDIDALVEGIVDGTIDCLTSNHTPLEQERKWLEFPYADFGAIGLETAYALSNEKLSQHLTQGELIHLWTYGSRKVFNLPLPTLEAGAVANLTIFDPSENWKYTTDQIRSKSKNSPFIGRTMQGKVQAIVNKGKVWKNIIP